MPRLLALPGALVPEALVLALALALPLAAPAHAGNDELDLLPLGRAGDFTLNAPKVEEAAASGWYLRGDGGYAASRSSGLDLGPLTAPVSLSGSGWTLGGGVGFRFTDWLRVDATADFVDLGSTSRGISARGTAFLANAYWDIGTFAGFTPYVGGGVGFAVTTLDGGAAWGPVAGTSGGNSRGFAWALAAGVSYALTSALSLDVGYRYMGFGSPEFGPPGAGVHMDDLGAHLIRVGLRFALN